MTVRSFASRRAAVAASVLALSLAPAVGFSAPRRPVHRDTFATPMRYERRTPASWPKGGTFRAGAEEARLMPPIGHLADARVSAEVRLERRSVDGWAYAGVELRTDGANAWQLLLVEGPDGRRYFEVIETYEGGRHAQTTPGAATMLPEGASGSLASWDRGATYRLTLDITPTSLSATATPADGSPAGAEWRREYDFGTRPVVREGRPALVAYGAEGAFLRFEVDAGSQSGRPTLAIARGRLGSAAVLDPRKGAAPRGLTVALTAAGFGVTRVRWDDLLTKRLPTDLDLLVLADARELPLQARDEVERMLCSGGRVIAIGAPAAMKLYARTAAGWGDQAAWTEALARAIRRTPMQVASAGWARTAFREGQAATIAPDPSEGAACWRVSCDLVGWDGWATGIAGAFGEDRDLLVLDARGDAATTHLAIECVEQDGSRWIAVIPLTTSWRTHVLRPEDFAYWMDSAAIGRGGSGDRLRPSRAARLSLTLSASHTPRVKPGPHTYWVRGLSTAASAPGDRPRFDLGDIEALWPSYKLYPMDQIATLRPSVEQGVVRPSDARVHRQAPSVAWTRPGYSPVWRERGRGIERGRAWRWIPVLEAYDRSGRKRGALVSLMVGDATAPNAMWANVAVADPADALREPILASVVALARAMARGVFLLEGGAEQFSYRGGETIRIGARALNAGRRASAGSVAVAVRDARGRTVFTASRPVAIGPGAVAPTMWTWKPARFDPRGYEVVATMTEGAVVTDRIRHRIEALRTAPARPEEFVRVRGSQFTLAGKPWHFRGINYWPTWMAGYPTLNQRSRECYDPEIIERDLAWLRKAGVNVLSAIQAIVPADPTGYRDQLDFLDRCLRHGIRCYMTLHAGRAYAGADFAKLREYIEQAGLRDHPAIMCWELAWEPIDGPWGGRLEHVRDDWNRWIVEQYGSIGGAVADWGFDPRPGPTAPVPTPTSGQCTTDGVWNRYVSAFARAHSDLIGRAYGEVVRPLRAWDPNHLISFRGGACGIPSGATFAHVHSIGVARHMDFLCPEGYNLQTGGWANPTPPDDIRKGGLVTYHFRHVSREKPIVWMEFGFTANGFGSAWSQERVRLKPIELDRQRDEIERFYSMIVESGSRGAAPWWLPGGFRLGENSDFGLVEPDGTERPSARVFASYQPRFADVVHKPPTVDLPMDLDGERRHAWEIYAPRYLEIVRAGGVPRLHSPGTGTTSADCPLTAVGGTPYNGSNPPRYLNSEFDAVEIEITPPGGGEGSPAWRPSRNGETIEVPAGSRVRCRAQIGNTGEAEWLASTGTGAVQLVAGKAAAPILAGTPYLGTARTAPFTLVEAVHERTEMTLRMEARGRAPFGERRKIIVVPTK